MLRSLCLGIIYAGFCLSLGAAPVNVTTLGVVPNDGLNDSATITAALASNPDLYFPPGTYNLASTVFIPSNRTINGAGPAQTKFVLLNDIVAFRVDNKTDIHIQGISIDRPFDNSVEEMIFVYNNSARVRVENCAFTRQRSRAPSVSFFRTNDAWVRNSYFSDYMRYRVEDGQNQLFGSAITFLFCDKPVVEYNTMIETRNMVNPSSTYFNYFQASAVQVSSCTTMRVENNTIINCGQGIDTSGSDGGLVRHNYVENSHSIAIKLVNGTRNLKVYQNYIKNAGLIGISIAPGNTEKACIFDTVIGNTIIGIGKGWGQDWWDGFFGGTTPAGVHLDPPNLASGRCHDLIILDNNFYDNSQMVYGFINRPGSYQAYNVTATNNISQAGAAPLPQATPTPYPVVVPGTLTNGTVATGTGEWLDRAADQQAITRGLINQGAAAGSARWSFVVDLTTATEVRSLALYGEYLYRTDEAAPGGLVEIEAANSILGPFTAIGSQDFGGDRATNPFTGGKGKRIIVTPTTARYLRISGGPWSSSFDNNVVISEIMVNPRVVLHGYAPVHNPGVALPNPASVPQQSVFDVGGGHENERVALDLVDGKPASGVNPLFRMTLTLDLAQFGDVNPTVGAFVLQPFSTDVNLLPKTGVVRVSSTDNPNNMDTVLVNFDQAVVNGVVTIPIPSTTKRYFQLQFTANQSGSTAENQQRIGEIDYTGQVPVELSGFELN